MYTINKLLTKINYSSRYGSGRRFIVIHYVGADGDAHDNARYFASGYRGASAHFFVDPHSIWQSVKLGYAAWHCGGGLQGSGGHKYFGICTNSNSIGIEMCIRRSGGKWIVEEETVKRVAWLVQRLMKKYAIPAEHVIRHYDVTGKICPGCYYNGHWLLNDDNWYDFRKILTGKASPKKKKKRVNGNGNTRKLWSGRVTAEDGLNIRKGPGIEYNRIGILKYKSKVKVYEVRSGWLRIDKGEWVSGYYVRRTSKKKKASKTTDQLAREVIAGKWGNGEDRRSRLTNAGYNYRKIQNRVNELLR